MRKYKMKIINNLMLFMLTNELLNEEKKNIYKIVIKLPYLSERQIRCFIRYFGLKPENFKKNSLTEIKNDEKKSSSNILQSIKSVIRKLYDIDYKDFRKLEKIYMKYQKENYDKIYNSYKDIIEKYINDKDYEKENMLLRKIDSRGKICIPIKIRKKLNINEGDIINVVNENNKIILKKSNVKEKYCTIVQKNGALFIPLKIIKQLNLKDNMNCWIYNVKNQIIIMKV